MKRLLPLLLFTATLPCMAQYSSELTIQQIMQGDRFVGYLPEDIEWSVDGKYIYFSWNPEMDSIRRTYRVHIETQKIEPATASDLIARPEIGTYNRSRTLMTYVKFGDLFLYDLKTRISRQITATTDQEYDVSFSGDEKNLIYTRSGNLYAWNISTGATRQLTNFKSGSKKKEADLSKEEQWLQTDQLALFEILKKRKIQKQLSDSLSEEIAADRPLEIYYGDKSLSNIKISPDLKFVTYTLREDVKTQQTKVPEYITESGFTTSSNARSKVGAPQDTYEFGIYDIENDTSFILDTRQIDGIFDKPEYLKEYAKEDYMDSYTAPREVIVHGPFYATDSKAVVEIRSMDNKDRWIMALEPQTGKLRLLDRQRDEAWVGGPGIPWWNISAGNIGWMPDDANFWFQSEESGYSHLYTVNFSTGKKKALTSGQYEINDAELSRNKKYFYLQASKESPFVNHFYRMPVSGGTLTKITTKEGSNEVTISPDEKNLAVLHSYSNQPWELYLMKNEPGAEMVRLTNSTMDTFEGYDWTAPEIVQFKARDGALVPARLYKPENPNGAGIIFVHGAGYLQNVHTWWSSYFREYMFHHFLMDMGYTVLDIDYRGSQGYGRDWRTGIYRWMGGKDLTDQLDGADYLVEEQAIDEDRLGIYGGSYGGFITLMAMFTAPGTFQSGAALRSVTDWAHYNHLYTSNILNTPVEDSLAYRKSSPIYHAAGLEGNLLILHGMSDDNVQFQDVVRLSQRLIELGKENWDLAVFPIEPHSFVESSSWTDEYRRIYKLFEETLK